MGQETQALRDHFHTWAGQGEPQRSGGLSEGRPLLGHVCVCSIPTNYIVPRWSARHSFEPVENMPLVRNRVFPGVTERGLLNKGIGKEGSSHMNNWLTGSLSTLTHDKA